MSECPYCKGKGWIWVAIAPDDVDRDICDECDGTGEIDDAIEYADFEDTHPRHPDSKFDLFRGIK